MSRKNRRTSAFLIAVYRYELAVLNLDKEYLFLRFAVSRERGDPRNAVEILERQEAVPHRLGSVLVLPDKGKNHGRCVIGLGRQDVRLFLVRGTVRVDKIFDYGVLAFGSEPVGKHGALGITPGPLMHEVQKRFEHLTAARIVEGYGLSVASPVTHANPIFGKRKIGSIGLPWPDTEARIVDIKTGERILPPGEPGELVVRGPQVMKGYWNKPAETAAALRGGWLHTGDIAKMDDDGYFYIVDRIKDMIKTVGENVYPREVEEVLFTHPKVKDAVVVGIPQEFLGEEIKAYIVLKDGEAATPGEIMQYCREQLSKFKVPKEIEFRKELPKTLVGKVLRRVLRDEEMKKEQTQKQKL